MGKMIEGIVGLAYAEWDFFDRQEFDIDGHSIREGMDEAEEGFWQRVGFTGAKAQVRTSLAGMTIFRGRWHSSHTLCERPGRMAISDSTRCIPFISARQSRPGNKGTRNTGSGASGFPSVPPQLATLSATAANRASASIRNPRTINPMRILSSRNPIARYRSSAAMSAVRSA
jgi:hypothetical protein